MLNSTGSVLIIGESTNPPSQQRFASEIPGAVTVEAVDLRDLVTFARNLNMAASGALLSIGEFAEKIMTNVGATDLVRRVDALMRGTEIREPSAVDRFGLENVYVLSASWGLIRADFLTPYYDITFSSSADAYKIKGYRLFSLASRAACA